MSSPDGGPKRAVVLAYPLELDGKKHDPDSTVELPAEDARQLVQDGRARWSESSTPASRSKAKES